MTQNMTNRDQAALLVKRIETNVKWDHLLATGMFSRVGGKTPTVGPIRPGHPGRIGRVV